MDATTRVKMMLGDAAFQLSVLEATVEAQAARIKELEAQIPKPEEPKHE